MKRKDCLEASLVQVLFADWIWVAKDTNTQATSEFINCKHWKYRKIKTTVLDLWPTSWSPGTSSCYCSDINLFLIDYAWLKLCNKWLLLFENNSKSLTLVEKNIVAVITLYRATNDNLKRQIKNQTLYTWRLFLLTWIFQYISNWSKVF